MNTDVVATVSESNADRLVRIRTELRDLVAEQVASRKERSHLKTQWRTDPEFRVQQSVHGKMQWGRHEIDDPCNLYQRRQQTLWHQRQSRSYRLRVLSLARAFLRGRVYARTEPGSRLGVEAQRALVRAQCVTANNKNPKYHLPWDLLHLVDAVATETGTSFETIFAWIRGLP